MAALVDTNVPVYRSDPRFPEKQQVATNLLRQPLRHGPGREPFPRALTEVHAPPGSGATTQNARRTPTRKMLGAMISSMRPRPGIAPMSSATKAGELASR